MAIEIEITNYPDQTVSTTATGTPLKVRLRWNGQCGYWFMDIMKPDNTMLVAGRRIKTNIQILPHGNIDGVNGNFFAIPEAYAVQELGLYPWGKTHKLVYVSNDEQ